MFIYYIQGLILGITYVAPIGMQNLYVINSAIVNRRIKAFQIALITVFFDVSLAITCFFGVGSIIASSQLIKKLVLIISSVVVIGIGIGLIRSVPEGNKGVKGGESLVRAAAACFTVTWLNPQAIIDGSLMLGGFRVSLPHNYSWLFMCGVCTASLSWFMLLTAVISHFKSSFNIKVVGIINKICGVVIIYYGVKLGISFFNML